MTLAVAGCRLLASGGFGNRDQVWTEALQGGFRFDGARREQDCLPVARVVPPFTEAMEVSSKSFDAYDLTDV